MLTQTHVIKVQTVYACFFRVALLFGTYIGFQGQIWTNVSTSKVH